MNIARMKNEGWFNWRGEILIDEKGKQDTWVGRNSSYKPVIVRGDINPPRRHGVHRKITSFDLRGEIV